MGSPTELAGRLSAVRYKNSPACDTTFSEFYSYDDNPSNKGGARTKKRLSIARSGVTSAMLDSSYQYDNEGRMTQQVYPSSWTTDALGNYTVAVSGPTLAYSYDTMGRLYSLVENGSNSVISSTGYTPAEQLQSWYRPLGSRVAGLQCDAAVDFPCFWSDGGNWRQHDLYLLTHAKQRKDRF